MGFTTGSRSVLDASDNLRMLLSHWIKREKAQKQVSPEATI
jgi:hypothetical protein